MKKSYLLLEVLIALALFVSCAVPLIQQPYKWLQKEKTMIQKMELERLADLAFADVYVKLCTHHWAWSELVSRPVRMRIKGEKEAELQIRCKKQEENALLLECAIGFGEQRYCYLAWIEKQINPVEVKKSG